MLVYTAVLRHWKMGILATSEDVRIAMTVTWKNICDKVTLPPHNIALTVFRYISLEFNLKPTF